MTAYLLSLLTAFSLRLDVIVEPEYQLPSSPGGLVPVIAVLVVALVVVTALLVRYFRKK